jgi:hypothetical protein
MVPLVTPRPSRTASVTVTSSSSSKFFTEDSPASFVDVSPSWPSTSHSCSAPQSLPTGVRRLRAKIDPRPYHRRRRQSLYGLPSRET